MWRNKRTAVAPDEECIAHGTKLLCQIHRGMSSHAGEMRDEQDKVRWQYRNRAHSANWNLGNPLKKPDFVIAEPGSKDEMVIRRVSLAPSVFKIIEAGKVIGTIRMLSVFRNEYSITIDGVSELTFRMPLFSVRFFGESGAGVEIWVRVGPSTMTWNILIKPDSTQRPLVAALAFIHHEWYFYS